MSFDIYLRSFALDGGGDAAEARRLLTPLLDDIGFLVQTHDGGAAQADSAAGVGCPKDLGCCRS